MDFTTFTDENGLLITDERLARAAMTGKYSGRKLSVADQLYAIHRLRGVLDQVERDTVHRGRRDGLTWAWFAEVFGTTRQAAQQRFREPTDHMF
jgi:hypothetical protein